MIFVINSGSYGNKPRIARVETESEALAFCKRLETSIEKSKGDDANVTVRLPEEWT